MNSETEDFVRLYQTDPYVALITRLRNEAWLMGYEAARRDAEAAASPDDPRIHPDNPHYEVVAALRQEGPSRLLARAAREMLGAKNTAEANAILALAALGRAAH